MNTSPLSGDGKIGGVGVHDLVVLARPAARALRARAAAASRAFLNLLERGMVGDGRRWSGRKNCKHANNSATVTVLKAQAFLFFTRHSRDMHFTPG